MSTPELEIALNAPGEEAVEKAASILLHGGIVIYPSDTVYGILCRAYDQVAVRRLAGLKDYHKPRAFIVLVSGIRMANSIASGLDEEVMGILNARWPGKLTVVLPASHECPSWVRAEDDTVALRHPADPLSGMLLERCNVPLVSTSANAAGGKPSLKSSSIPRRIIEGSDMVLSAGKLPSSLPSTIIKVIRHGLIPDNTN